MTSLTVDNWLSSWRGSKADINLVLVLAGSKTAEVAGISKGVCETGDVGQRRVVVDHRRLVCSLLHCRGRGRELDAPHVVVGRLDNLLSTMKAYLRSL